MSRSLNNFDDRSGDIQASDYVVGYRPAAKGSRYQFSNLVSWLAAQFSGLFAPASHTHTATSISDSTATGQAVVTAANQAAALGAVGAAALLHSHAPTDLQSGGATDGQVLMWSTALNRWVPTSISAITTVQVLDEDDSRVLDEDDYLILDESI